MRMATGASANYVSMELRTRRLRSVNWLPVPRDWKIRWSRSWRRREKAETRLWRLFSQNNHAAEAAPSRRNHVARESPASLTRRDIFAVDSGTGFVDA